MKVFDRGIDQPVASLSLYARYRLAALLDPKEGRKKGWKALAALLGLAAEAASLEIDLEASGEAMATVSPTDLMLAEWTRNVGETAATIRALHGKLLEMDRPDVIDALLNVVPLYRFVPDDGSVFASGMTAPAAPGGGANRHMTPSSSSAGSSRPVSVSMSPPRPASTTCTTTL